MPHKPKRVLLEGVENVTASKIIGCNTLKVLYSDGRQAVRYHHTDVITFFPNGDIQLNSGGWRTVTTKLRFNSYSPVRVYSDKGIWYVNQPNDKPIPYVDGMIFDSNGLVKDKGKLNSPDLKEVNKLKKQIGKYVKLVDSLNPIPFPNNGDCWYCCMHDTATNKPLGDSVGDISHLMDHLKEGYIHGSIIFNALKERGYKDPGLIIHMQIKDSIKRTLRKYLYKRLLPEVMFN